MRKWKLSRQNGGEDGEQDEHVANDDVEDDNVAEEVKEDDVAEDEG